MKYRTQIATAFLTITILLLSGCASNIRPFLPEIPDITHVVDKTPTLNEVSEATVGSSLIRVKDYFLARQQVPALKLVSSNDPNLAVGSNFNIEGTIQLGEKEYLLGACIGLNDAMTADGCLAIDEDNLISVGRWVQGLGIVQKSFAGLRFEWNNTETVSTERGYTNFEILYSGVSGDVLRLRYREYSPDDLAREAYFQDLTYSMSDRIIQFRTIEVEVLEANNRKIRYIVKGY
tara:strand:- start:557 stop:1258 length:702 start_codon:yes stop_codon:yes gene_type:complete